MASVIVRAVAPPTAMVYRITAGDCAYSLQVVKMEPKQKVTVATALPPAHTWAEVTKRSLGKHETLQVPTPVQPPRVSQPPVPEPTAVWPAPRPEPELPLPGEEDEMDDDEDDDYEDDAYVEEMGPEADLPKTTSSTKRRKVERWTRAGKATARMKTLEDEMSAVREQLGTILSALSSLQQAPVAVSAPLKR